MAEETGNDDETSWLPVSVAERRSASFCSAKSAPVLNGLQPAKICQPEERSPPKLQQPAHLRYAQRTSNAQWRREALTTLRSLKVNSSNYSVPSNVNDKSLEAPGWVSPYSIFTCE